MIETYSAMVALYPDEVTKQIISRLMAGREGAYNPEDLHCTIVFLGDDFIHNDDVNREIVQRLSVKAQRLPFYAEVSAQTMFGPDYSVLLVDGRGIAELYTDISRELESIGIHNASEHGFCAHMSIASCACDDIGALQMPLVFDRLVLAIGPYRYEIG